jgi:hypothetical protein
LLPSTEGRKFFVYHTADLPAKQAKWRYHLYKAAASESYPVEAEKYGLETFTIKKGLHQRNSLDWQKDVTIVGKTFQRMLNEPNIDKNGYCLEVYLNEKDDLHG